MSEAATQTNTPPNSPSLTREEVVTGIIRAVYKAVLGRDADESGLAHFSGELLPKLSSAPLDEVFADMMMHGLGSPEGRERLLPWMAGLHTPRWVPAQQQASFSSLRSADALPPRGPDQFISLGSTGLTSAGLKRFGLKQWSGPFDWIRSSPALVRHCLNDDFGMLLNRSQYRRVPKENRGGVAGYADHAQFREMFGLQKMFSHYDPTTEEAYAYLLRCVQRFRQALRGPERKAMVMVVQGINDPRVLHEEFRDTAIALEKNGDRAGLIMVGLSKEKPEGPFPELEDVFEKGPHRLMRMRATSSAPDNSFGDPLDDIVLMRAVIDAAKLPED